MESPSTNGSEAVAAPFVVADFHAVPVVVGDRILACAVASRRMTPEEIIYFSLANVAHGYLCRRLSGGWGARKTSAS